MPPVPSGLLPKTPIAALQSLAGNPTRLRLRALRWAFPAVQRVCAHSVNRPYGGLRHLIVQPIDACCSTGARPVRATCAIAS